MGSDWNRSRNHHLDRLHADRIKDIPYTDTDTHFLKPLFTPFRLQVYRGRLISISEAVTPTLRYNPSKAEAKEDSLLAHDDIMPSHSCSCRQRGRTSSQQLQRLSRSLNYNTHQKNDTLKYTTTFQRMRHFNGQSCASVLLWKRSARGENLPKHLKRI